MYEDFQDVPQFMANILKQFHIKQFVTAYVWSTYFVVIEFITNEYILCRDSSVNHITSPHCESLTEIIIEVIVSDML